MGGNYGSLINEELIQEIKEKVFSFNEDDPHALVSTSAYDTAWVAMIPDHADPFECRPMFPGCLSWILKNQKTGGFWGEAASEEPETPTVECITATLACMVALRMWNVGHQQIAQGLDLLRSNAEDLLLRHKDNLPPWFPLVLPGMLELSSENGLDVFPRGLPDAVKAIFNQRDLQMLQRKEFSNQRLWPPLLAYLEVLPQTSKETLSSDDILRHRMDDGSLFRSPSATAAAFMITKDQGFASYLEAAVGSRTSERGVPSIYPVDETLIKMSLVDWIESVGCEEHFKEEIRAVLKLVYSDWSNREFNEKIPEQVEVFQLYRDALAFRLLRMHGYDVSPSRFCWFVDDKDILHLMENKYEYFLSALLNVYKASHLVFPGERQLDEAKAFAEEILKKGDVVSNVNIWKDGVAVLSNLSVKIDLELQHPWITRMTHLENRKAIENGSIPDLWMSKASTFRIPCLNNGHLLQLAKENFQFRQSVFKEELEEIKMWAKEKGLSSIGFGREKSTYCYYLTSTNMTDSHIANARKLVAKSAAFVTVADDFYDTEGDLMELDHLTKAVQRWEGDGLPSSSKIIFDALDDLVRDTSREYYDKTKDDITKTLRGLWKESFEAWLQEAKWSRDVHAPSLSEYVRVGTTSVAIPAMILPACYLQHASHAQSLNIDRYEDITLLTMMSCRMLNDTQSYEKEREEGKLNMVLLSLKENPASNIDNIVHSMKDVVEAMKRKVLQLTLLDNQKGSRMPKAWKDTHLVMLKAFHMLYQSGNLYDSQTSLLPNIDNAFNNELCLVL